MVWPALFPPAKRAQMSASADRISTSLPLPSSPHCAPRTAVTAPMMMTLRCQLIGETPCENNEVANRSCCVVSGLLCLIVRDAGGLIWDRSTVSWAVDGEQFPLSSTPCLFILSLGLEGPGPPPSASGAFLTPGTARRAFGISQRVGRTSGP